jgi:hypothetical protein
MENTATWMNTKVARLPGLSPNRWAASRPAGGQGGALHDREDVGARTDGPDQPRRAGPRRRCGGDGSHGDARSLLSASGQIWQIWQIWPCLSVCGKSFVLQDEGTMTGAAGAV